MSIDNVIDEHFAFVSAEYNSGLMVRLTIDSGVRGLAALESLNRALDKPFGEVPLSVRALAFALSELGYPIVRRDGDRLTAPIETPMWCSQNVYQVLRKAEEVVLPSIDWTHVSPRLKWLAQDASGALMLFEKMPLPCEGGAWGNTEFGWSTHADNFASARRGSGDYRKLIVQRPEGA